MSLAMYRYALPFTTKPLQGPGVQFAKEADYAVKMAELLSSLVSRAEGEAHPLLVRRPLCQLPYQVATPCWVHDAT